MRTLTLVDRASEHVLAKFVLETGVIVSADVVEQTLRHRLLHLGVPSAQGFVTPRDGEVFLDGVKSFYALSSTVEVFDD